MNGDEDYRTIIPVPDDEPVELSPVARAVLWATCAVLAMVAVAVLLAVLSVLIGGHYWWLRP